MMSPIYTRKGDKGETSLANGERIEKDAPRIEAYGSLDELTSWAGLAVAEAQTLDDAFFTGAISFFQSKCYNAAANLAMPKDARYQPPAIQEADIVFLEQAIDKFEKTTGALKRFVLPGGSKAAAMLHVARTVCRRAERRIVSMQADVPVDERVVRFVNRASDFLFVAARYANALEIGGDTLWDTEMKPPKI